MRRIYLFVAPPYHALLRETTDVSHFSRNPIRASNVWKSRCCRDFPRRFISPLARSLCCSAARITQAEGRDGTFQSQIGTRIKSVCPMLARVARRWMSCSLESFGEGALKCKWGRTAGVPIWQNFLRKCCRLWWCDTSIFRILVCLAVIAIVMFWQ